MTLYAVIYLILLTVFLVWGLIIFVLYIRNGQKTAWLLEHGKRITATVTNVETQQLSRGQVMRGSPLTRYKVLASWCDPQTGQEYTFERQRLYQAPQLQPGATVTVLLDPRNPRRYYIQLHSI